MTKMYREDEFFKDIKITKQPGISQFILTA